MIKNFKADFLSYGSEVKGLIIGKYSNLFELKKQPLFARTLGKDGYYLSEVTRQKDGVVYIPWKELKKGLKFKISYGKRDSYFYEIYEILSLETYVFTAKVKEYRREKLTVEAKLVDEKPVKKEATEQDFWLDDIPLPDPVEYLEEEYVY